MHVVKSRHKIAIGLLVGALLGCAGPKRMIGTYSDTTGGPAFAGRELTLRADNTFVLNEWTDAYSVVTDEDGGIRCDGDPGKGSGTYRVMQDTLLLAFTSRDFLSCRLKVRAGHMTDTIDIHMADEMGRDMDMTTIESLNGQQQRIELALTDSLGRVRWIVGKNDRPAFIRIAPFAGETRLIDLREHSRMAIYEIRRCFGYYPNGSEERLWFRRKGQYLYYRKADHPTAKLKRLQ